LSAQSLYAFRAEALTALFNYLYSAQKDGKVADFIAVHNSLAMTALLQFVALLVGLLQLDCSEFSEKRIPIVRRLLSQECSHEYALQPFIAMHLAEIQPF
jgi:hypothetical protein